MEDFGLVEADFQQYYHIDLEETFEIMLAKGTGFLRFCRLFKNLPSDCRVMKKLDLAGSWTWQDETMSRTLAELSEIKAIMFNRHRKKGQKALKPDEQFQPDYVKKAKKDYIKWQKSQRNNVDDVETMKAFWKSRNPDVKAV